MIWWGLRWGLVRTKWGLWGLKTCFELGAGQWIGFWILEISTFQISIHNRFIYPCFSPHSPHSPHIPKKYSISIWFVTYLGMKIMIYMWTWFMIWWGLRWGLVRTMRTKTRIDEGLMDGNFESGYFKNPHIKHIKAC